MYKRSGSQVFFKISALKRFANFTGKDLFWNLSLIKSLIKEETYYKNPNEPSCIDLILTNKPKFPHQHSCVIEAGLSDFHKMTVTFMMTFFEKLQPRVVY